MNTNAKRTTTIRAEDRASYLLMACAVVAARRERHALAAALPHMPISDRTKPLAERIVGGHCDPVWRDSRRGDPLNVPPEIAAIVEQATDDWQPFDHDAGLGELFGGDAELADEFRSETETSPAPVPAIIPA